MSESFSHDDILEILKKARLFTQFTDENLSHLISRSTVEKFGQGDVIIREGRKNEKVYIILSGVVAVYAENEYILKLRRQGDIVGEMSVITKSPTTASVVADSAVELFNISAGSIDKSGQLELQSMLYKIFLDILTEKLTMTTNRVKGFQATTVELDIKKQQLAKSEDNLHQKDAILQSVLGSMSDGVVVTETNGNLLHLNEAFRQMVGGAKIPFEFEHWPQKLGFFHGDEKTPYSPDELPMVKIMKGEQVDYDEIFVKNDNLQESLWLQASSRLLRDEENGKTKGAVVVFRDFTKKKKEEQALIKAKESAEAMSKAKSDFLAVMSHELRTPLNSIIGMTDVVYSTDMDSEQQDCMDTIKKAGDNLLKIISSILEYNNLESGTVKSENRAFSVQDCFGEIDDVYASNADNQGLKLLFHISPDLPGGMSGDDRGIKQVLKKLTDNAIKFTEQGSVNISADFRTAAENRIDILFTVEDTGIGIDPEHITNLFQAFSQVDSSYSRKYEGTGIGLSICKKLVALMKGKIWVESELGIGSKFQFSVPVDTLLSEDESAAELDAPRDKAEIPELDQHFAEKVTLDILVAEDNLLNQKLVGKILKKLGYTPKIVSNGLEAVEAFRKESFDLVLMDLQMPEMDGLEASRIICSESTEDNDPKIIALTANVSEEVKDTCLNAGMRDYMTKPLKIAKLAEMLFKWSAG
ncbi:MAG: response regulator [Proteobacteria bacterium]|nr:response regulator [Pseudomonadota bacterium]